MAWVSGGLLKSLSVDGFTALASLVQLLAALLEARLRITLPVFGGSQILQPRIQATRVVELDPPADELASTARGSIRWQPQPERSTAGWM